MRARVAERVLFKDAATDYIALHAPGWTNAKHAKQWHSTLGQYVLPTLGSRPVNEIDTPSMDSEAGQAWMDVKIEQCQPELVIFDNVQALIAGDHTKEESWTHVLPWLKSLTKRHIGQIWFHHTGHNEGHTSTRIWQMARTRGRCQRPYVHAQVSKG